MRILFTIFFLSLCLFGKSECQYHLIELKLKIITTDNSSITFYSSMSLCDFNSDSINSKPYLLRALKRWSTNDSITVFKDVIRYEYFIFDTIVSKEKNIVSSRINEINLFANDIESITVIEYNDVSVFDFISTELELADTNWLYTFPVSEIGYGAYLCSHRILLYNKSVETNRVLEQLDNLQKEVDLKIDSMNQTEGDEYDEKFWSLIVKLKNLDKIVVVSSCTD
jgi:hypothetical protein